MPSVKLIQKLKPALQNQLPPEQDGILLCLDSDNVTGDNAKYMKMYNRLARWYDFGERWIARLRYGNSINETRRSLMNELEWRQDCTALYVSIGTGTDLNHLPADINLSALDLTGADLSLGMLERCRDVWRKKRQAWTWYTATPKTYPLPTICSTSYSMWAASIFSATNKKPSTKCCALPSPVPKS